MHVMVFSSISAPGTIVSCNRLIGGRVFLSKRPLANILIQGGITQRVLLLFASFGSLNLEQGNISFFLILHLIRFFSIFLRGIMAFHSHSLRTSIPSNPQ